MGLLQDAAVHLEPLTQKFAELSFASRIGVVLAGFLAAVVFLNVLHQVLFRNPNEPPVVFHWFPVIGSTVTYGMDPPRFFRANQAKVRAIAAAPTCFFACTANSS